MFNHNIKEQYIEEKLASANLSPYTLTKRFVDSEPFEESAGKDVCEFTYYDIMDMYKMLDFNQLETLYNVHTIYITYADWCIRNNMVYDNQNHFRELKRDDLVKCIAKAKLNKKFLSKKEIESLCSRLPNYRDRFLILSIFEIGKSSFYQDILHLKIEDFRDNKAYLFDGRIVDVSDLLIIYAKEAVKEDKITSLKSEKIIDLPDSQFIYRFTYDTSKSEKNQGRSIRQNIDNIRNFLGVEYLKPGNIVESGKLHFCLKKMKEYNLDFSDYVNQYYKEIDNQFGCRTKKSVYIHTYESIIKSISGLQ